MKCSGLPLKDFRPQQKLNLTCFADVPENQRAEMIVETRRIWTRAFIENNRRRPLETFGEASENNGFVIKRKRIIFLLTRDGINVHHPFKEVIWGSK